MKIYKYIHSRVNLNLYSTVGNIIVEFIRAKLKKVFINIDLKSR